MTIFCFSPGYRLVNGRYQEVDYPDVPDYLRAPEYPASQSQSSMAAMVARMMRQPDFFMRLFGMAPRGGSGATTATGTQPTTAAPTLPEM